MSMKGFFNQNSKQTRNDVNEFEQQILRINTLEVHMKNLLKFEKQVRTFMFGMGRGEKNSLSVEEEKERERRLLHLVERRLSEKLATHIKKQEMMQDKVRSLEGLILKLMERDNHQLSDFSKEERINQSKLEGIAAIGSPCDGDELEKVNVESFDSHIKMRVLALENNYLLVNEVQAELLKRVDILIEKCNDLTKKMVEAEDATMLQDSICNTLYIDKLYLDKYEQNNNFAQLGINHLSGALNIGATYGRDAIPKNITEQVKEDLAKMKTVKEEMEKSHTSAEKQPDSQTSAEKQPESQSNESSSQISSIPPEEDIPYTDIVIEDDSSLGT